MKKNDLRRFALVLGRKNVLGELTEDVTSGSVLASNVSATRAVDLGAANLVATLPDHLSEVTSGLAELTRRVVVLVLLVVPGIKSILNGAVTNGDVLTVRTTAVSELAVGVVKVVLSEVSELAVPAHRTNLVDRTHLVVVVNDLALEAAGSRGGRSRRGGAGASSGHRGGRRSGRGRRGHGAAARGGRSNVGARAAASGRSRSGRRARRGAAAGSRSNVRARVTAGGSLNVFVVGNSRSLAAGRSSRGLAAWLSTAGGGRSSRSRSRSAAGGNRGVTVNSHVESVEVGLGDHHSGGHGEEGKERVLHCE